jgi:hypothetical protein
MGHHGSGSLIELHLVAGGVLVRSRTLLGARTREAPPSAHATEAAASAETHDRQCFIGGLRN